MPTLPIGWGSVTDVGKLPSQSSFPGLSTGCAAPFAPWIAYLHPASTSSNQDVRKWQNANISSGRSYQSQHGRFGMCLHLMWFSSFISLAMWSLSKDCRLDGFASIVHTEKSKFRYYPSDP
jgi:hypothetical protein